MENSDVVATTSARQLLQFERTHKIDKNKLTSQRKSLEFSAKRERKRKEKRAFQSDHVVAAFSRRRLGKCAGADVEQLESLRRGKSSNTQLGRDASFYFRFLYVLKEWNLINTNEISI